MTIQALTDLIKAHNCTPELPMNQEVSCGYTCDLLSWVMAHGKQGMAWITVQTHMNVIAVAVLMEMSCVIVPEGIHMEEASIAKAAEEGVVVLERPMTASELCGLMTGAGLPGSV